FFSPQLRGMGASIDFEMVLPYALKNLIPVGWVGLILAGLIAAFMSNYAATINAAPAYVVNDIYKRFINPDDHPKKYVRMSYIVSIIFVLLGFLFGLIVGSINEVMLWIVSALWGGYTAANVLKWYWWRLNGYGYFWGMVAGIGAALLMPVLMPSVAAIYAFPYILGVSILGCVAGTLLTEPESEEVLIDFYMRVKPWGFWGPVLAKVRQRHPQFRPNRNFGRDMFNVAVGIAWQTSLVALPIFIVIHESTSMLIALAVTVGTSVILKFTWWDRLGEIAESEDTPAADARLQPVPDISLTPAGEKQ
ncbi:MAG TPA: sodium:solute symporter, partial [Bacteroidota bacterium]|nr:sodium:solute symporter [Bacteroidota bacterium]